MTIDCCYWLGDDSAFKKKNGLEVFPSERSNRGGGNLIMARSKMA